MVDELTSTILPFTILVLFQTAPIWVPFFLVAIFWPKWVKYVQAEFIFSQEHKLLQIKLPKEMFKSPLSMELFLTTLHQTGGEGSWYDKYWLGKSRAWFSLEMASIEGNVGFYIWTRKGMKGFIESSLYAQYPGIEVHEVPDYALPVQFDETKMKMWAADLQLTKDDAYPIKTYVDYGLDKDPKEEFKIDPIAPVIEFLGSVGANQQAWIQIIVRAYKADKLKPGTLFSLKHDPLKESMQKIINEMMFRDPKTKVVGKKKEGEDKIEKPTLTKGEQDVITAIERNMTKLQFEVGIRVMYFGKSDFYNPSNISGLTGSWKQYSSDILNGFKPNGDNYSPSFSYPWQDFRGKRLAKSLKEALEGYKRRSFFFPPVKGKAFVLSSEELATIFHFPGQVSQAPTFTRILSKKSEAPSNLPI